MTKELIKEKEDVWTVEDAENLYRVKLWGESYFYINEQGHLSVRPILGDSIGIDMFTVVQDLKQQRIQFPLLIRFQDLLRSRVTELNTAFRRAIEEAEYKNTYIGVYPIKVNQLHEVVQEILEAGRPFNFGLECGSKAELVAALPHLEDDRTLLICNGYKDWTMMKLLLIGQLLGKNIIPILEKYSELRLMLSLANELGVRPKFGVRVRVSVSGSGKWAASGGDASKFGITIPELVKMIDEINASGIADGFKLLHFHLGSQIPDIRVIKAGLEEISRYYAELRGMGFNRLDYVDVGGGLGVDYDGSRSTRAASVNYSMREYANDVVYTLGNVCRSEELPMPHIISESGRALTAHHSLLLVNVIDVESLTEPVAPKLREEPHPLLLEMAENLESFAADRVQEVFHDVVFARERAHEYFASGVFSLRDKADAEQFYLCTLNAIAAATADDKAAYPEIAAHIESVLVDRYFCNFSVFQSLPDNWAIDQIFPIMPIHRLNEPPTRRGTLQDITCDSDGVIDRFTGGRKGKPSLELHPVIEDEPYILGIFLTGAYQEILGDLHNLFGDTNAVHVRLTDQGYEVTDLVHGDTVTEVLNYVQFHASDLLATFRRKVGKARELSRQEANSFIADYVAGLEGYTYLEGDGS